ncbi:hypothetical protein ABZ319_01415 [Nocardia sp. NPDC005978]
MNATATPDRPRELGGDSTNGRVEVIGEHAGTLGFQRHSVAQVTR